MSIILSLSTQPYSCRYSTGVIFVFALLRKMADSRSVGCNHGERFITLKKRFVCVCPCAYTGTHMYTHEVSLFNMWTGDQAQGLRFGGRCLYTRS